MVRVGAALRAYEEHTAGSVVLPGPRDSGTHDAWRAADPFAAALDA
jgi:hypothetical protein